MKLRLSLLIAMAVMLSFGVGAKKSKKTKKAEAPIEQAAPLQTPEAGRIDRHYVYSPQLGEKVTIDVWLPEAYENSLDSLPVIYMHDGQNLYDRNTTWNHQSWNVDSIATSLIRQDVIIPPIVVGVHSQADSRLATLMPVKAVSSLGLENVGDAAQMLNGMTVRGDEYVDFLASTLKPMIDSLYRTRPDRNNTYVSGSSMGGLISIYTLCERPDVFGNAMCLSTHWSGFPGCSDEFAAGLREYVRCTLPDVKDAFAEGYVPRLYFDHGTTTIDAGYGEYEKQFVKMLNEKGYGPTYLMTYVADGAPHEEQAWEKRFYLPLIFMLHK